MTRNDNSLHFTCPRCMSWLKASPHMAKSRHRCPRCQLVVEVPEKSQHRPKEDGYGVQKEPTASPAPPTNYIPVICHVCHTRMYGTVEQVGQELACPDCSTKNIVPPPTAAPMPPPARQVHREEYALLDTWQGTSGVKAVEGHSLIRIICPQCSTMMYAHADQIGMKLVCPDCEMPVVVPRPEDPHAQKHGDVGQYALLNEVDRTTGETPAAERTYIAVNCPRCNTRMQADLDQVGQTLTCPDCSTKVVVPSPRTGQTWEGQGRATSEINKTWSEPPARPDFVANKDYRDPEMVAEREAERAAREEAAQQAAQGWPPLRLFFAGTFTVPFSQDLLGRTLGLMAYAIVTPVLLGLGFGGGQSGSEVEWIGRLFFVLSAAGLLLFWIVTASAFGLAILRETAFGNEQIQHCPNLLALEGVFDVIYVVFALIYGALPGLFLAGLTPPIQLYAQLCVNLSQFVFTPICLLAMLEAGSLLKPLSPPIWRTVWNSWQAWVVFYMVSFAMFVATIALQVTAMNIGGPVLGIMVSGVVNTVVWLAYFRLLGRLAWFCSGQHAAKP